MTSPDRDQTITHAETICSTSRCCCIYLCINKQIQAAPSNQIQLKKENDLYKFLIDETRKDQHRQIKKPLNIKPNQNKIIKKKIKGT